MAGKVQTTTKSYLARTRVPDLAGQSTMKTCIARCWKLDGNSLEAGQQAYPVIGACRCWSGSTARTLWRIDAKGRCSTAGHDHGALSTPPAWVSIPSRLLVGAITTC